MNSSKAFQRGFPNDGNEVDNHPSMADVLIVSRKDPDRTYLSLLYRLVVMGFVVSDFITLTGDIPVK